jgi:ankyrin repeat protein
MKNQNKIHSILRFTLFSFFLFMLLNPSLVYVQETDPQEPDTESQNAEQSKNTINELNQGLITAVQGGRVDEVRQLLAQGADVNVKNRMGMTPIHMAAIAGYLNIVEILLKNGADANAKNNRDQNERVSTGDLQLPTHESN